MVEKALCDGCNEPAQLISEPNWALYCPNCGNECVLTYDLDRSITFDLSMIERDGFWLKNPRRLE